MKKEDYKICESFFCLKCKSKNRQRQLAYVLCKSVEELIHNKVRCLKDFIGDPDLAIYNTESSGAIHNNLSKIKNYTCSEYCGPQYKRGEIVDGVLHEDLMDLSFADKTFDIVLSADVLKHVPRPYDAHREIHRVIKKNGRHILTVAFFHTEFLDKTRVTHDKNGKLCLMKKAEHN